MEEVTKDKKEEQTEQKTDKTEASECTCGCGGVHCGANCKCRQVFAE